MNPYVQEYMNITSGQTTWFSSTILAFQAIFMPLGGLIASRINYRWVLLAGLLFSSGGILLTSLTVKYGIGPYIASYCACFGIGMGLPYSLIFSIASSWFPDSRATVVGIVAAGFGLGALVFTPIQTRLIYPKNLDKIPKAFLILGGIVLGLEIVAMVLLREKPQDKNVELLSANDGDTSVEQVRSEKDERSAKNGPKSYTIMQALRSIDFYILWFIVFLDIIPVVLLTSTYKIFGFDLNFPDEFLSPIATTSAAFNCLGRVFWGFMVDKFSSKCPMMTFLSIWAAVFITFPFVGAGSKASGQPLYAIWVFLLFFALSAHFVVVPATCNRIFGPQNMATIYGIIYFATTPSALATAAIVSSFKLKGHWVEVYTSCGVVCIVGKFIDHCDSCSHVYFNSLGFFHFLAALTLSLFLRDKDAKCVGCTNSICASACNSCRKGLDAESRRDVVDSEDASAAPWTN
ncbi:unnamed protein product [Rodentolepis nana]|uniref:MFS domain-containing protein n=1 Tax=Rodentolepis nana TaxID=102285 RepID=A0A0R3TX74_RODNA|nr:unnamed protein product [Rodentolepis nana]